LSRVTDVSPGRVSAGHYHSRGLATPAELVNALAYLVNNAAHHFAVTGCDRFSSAAYGRERLELVLSHPRTWLLRAGWRRARRRPPWLDEHLAGCDHQGR